MHLCAHACLQMPGEVETRWAAGWLFDYVCMHLETNRSRETGLHAYAIVVCSSTPAVASSPVAQIAAEFNGDADSESDDCACSDHTGHPDFSNVPRCIVPLLVSQTCQGSTHSL